MIINFTEAYRGLSEGPTDMHIDTDEELEAMYGGRSTDNDPEPREKMLEEHGFKIVDFVVVIPEKRVLTDEELDAINFLQNEWDYGWERLKE